MAIVVTECDKTNLTVFPSITGRYVEFFSDTEHINTVSRTFRRPISSFNYAFNFKLVILSKLESRYNLSLFRVILFLFQRGQSVTYVTYFYYKVFYTQRTLTFPSRYNNFSSMNLK